MLELEWTHPDSPGELECRCAVEDCGQRCGFVEQGTGWEPVYMTWRIMARLVENHDETYCEDCALWILDSAEAKEAVHG